MEGARSVGRSKPALLLTLRWACSELSSFRVQPDPTPTGRQNADGQQGTCSERTAAELPDRKGTEVSTSATGYPLPISVD